MPLTRTEDIVVSSIGIVAALNSFTGICCMGGCFVTFLQFRKSSSRLVVALGVSDFIWIMSIFIALIWSLFTVDIPTPACYVLGFLLQWFNIATDCWVVFISLHLYLRIVHNKGGSLGYEIWAHILCWGVPFFVALLPMVGIGGGYGMAGTWCWVVEPKARLFFSYTFAWGTCIFIFVTYAGICYQVWASGRRLKAYRRTGKPLSLTREKKRRKENLKYFRRLSLFPVIFVLMWIPATVNRIQNAMFPERPSVVLYSIHIFVTLSGGWINSSLYGVGIRHTIFLGVRDTLYRIFCHRRIRRKRMELLQSDFVEQKELAATARERATKRLSAIQRRFSRGLSVGSMATEMELGTGKSESDERSERSDSDREVAEEDGEPAARVGGEVKSDADDMFWYFETGG